VPRIVPRDAPPPPPPPWPPGPEPRCYPAECSTGDVEACTFVFYDDGVTRIECGEGTRSCVGTTGCWGECRPTVLPGREDCNDVDDDCDGLVDESSNRWPEPFGEPYRICEDLCFCSDEACQIQPWGTKGCVSLGFGRRCNDHLECTDDICRAGHGWPGCEEGECCENEPDDAFCSGPDHCFCDGLRYCEPRTPHPPSVEVSGCETFAPCEGPSYCQIGACCDTRGDCYPGVMTPDLCVTGISSCLLPGESCGRARDARSPCCSEGCPGTGDCGLYFEEVDHPVTGVNLGGVYCAERLWFLRDCGGDHDDRCNTHRCSIDAEQCMNTRGGSCDDGLDCTTGDSCREAGTHSHDPIPSWVHNDYECQGTAGICSDVAFCSIYPPSGNPGVNDVVCQAGCGDESGDGVMDSSCLPRQAPGQPSGCMMVENATCRSVYDSAGMCDPAVCSNSSRSCFLDPVDCPPDGVACTVDACNPSTGLCEHNEDDWLCPPGPPIQCCDLVAGCGPCID
jgi:hypothetical protein